MKQELIQSFVMQHGECFDPAQLQQIQNQLAEVPDEKSSMILGSSYQKPTVILIIAILLGWDRFFLDDIGLGIVGSYRLWLRHLVAYRYLQRQEESVRIQLQEIQPGSPAVQISPLP